ncbi:MAG TPA: hypothetical protein VFV73_40315 [Streptosporangiaceae bacterium]|nr:hypothetical protein [Streptosporangiaceae bacterium]
MPRIAGRGRVDCGDPDQAGDRCRGCGRPAARTCGPADAVAAAA